jgi:hypothetical protein
MIFNYLILPRPILHHSWPAREHPHTLLRFDLKPSPI